MYNFSNKYYILFSLPFYNNKQLLFVKNKKQKGEKMKQKSSFETLDKKLKSRAKLAVKFSPKYFRKDDISRTIAAVIKYEELREKQLVRELESISDESVKSTIYHLKSIDDSCKGMYRIKVQDKDIEKKLRTGLSKLYSDIDRSQVALPDFVTAFVGGIQRKVDAYCFDVESKKRLQDHELMFIKRY